MEETRGPIAVYIAGDKIIVGNQEFPEDNCFRFRHEMNVSTVTATFLHEDGEAQIVLSGYPESEARGQTIPTSSGPRHIRYGKVRLSGLVQGKDPPGQYRCIELAAKTTSGKELPFQDIPKLSFIVVREPERPPHLAGAITLGPQRDMFHGGGYDETKDEFVRPE